MSDVQINYYYLFFQYIVHSSAVQNVSVNGYSVSTLLLGKELRIFKTGHVAIVTKQRGHLNYYTREYCTTL